MKKPAFDYVPLAEKLLSLPTRLSNPFVSSDDRSRAESPSTQMAIAMAATGRPFYEGTVAPAVKAQRRRRNRAARIARSTHRR